MTSSIFDSDNHSLSGASRLDLDKTSIATTAFCEYDHHLEKLEFALAFALMEGNKHQATLLQEKITALGQNAQEPGT